MTPSPDQRARLAQEGPYRALPKALDSSGFPWEKGKEGVSHLGQHCKGSLGQCRWWLCWAGSEWHRHPHHDKTRFCVASTGRGTLRVIMLFLVLESIPILKLDGASHFINNLGKFLPLS